ncbi:hypothetical protein E4U41_000600 [Claviceps citrina]|nr:hypothetical protein E4U41_000600 [Claviceps citrina]
MAQDLVLITGATGMVGFRTLRQLLETGYSVRAAVRTQAGFDRIRSLECIRSYTSRLSGVVVADIAVPGAYDEAVRGVKFIVHVASPLAPGHVGEVDYELCMIRPAVHGTVGLLTSASKVGSVEKVVITGSLASIASWDRMVSGELIDESTLDVDTKSPLNGANAVPVTKARAYAAIKDFLRHEKPTFTVTNILPVMIIGRDDTVTDVDTITRKGTNSLVLGHVLGAPRFKRIPSLVGSTVHVDDVARMHVLALDRAVEGGQDFIATAGPVHWADAFDIVRRRFPRECGEGVFPLDDAARPTTIEVAADNAKAKRVLGMQFKSFEEQLVSVVGHYLELRGAASASAEMIHE